MPTTKVVNIDAGPHRARVFARRDALVMNHLSLAAGIAHAIARDLPRTFEREDLAAEAYVALIRAATSYRPRAYGGIPFCCWARLKVRGAVLDAIRARWSDGRGKHGYRPLPVSIEGPADLHGQLEAREYHGSEGADALDRAAPAPRAEERIDDERRRRRVARAIATLPAPEIEVLARRYGRGEETFAQIGARLAMNRHRVAALHASAIQGLRRELRAA